MVHEHRVPEFLCHEWPFFGNRNLPTNPDVAIMIGKAEYAKRVNRASCVRLTAIPLRYFPEKRIDLTGRQAGFDDDDAHGIPAVTDRRWERDTRGRQ